MAEHDTTDVPETTEPSPTTLWSPDGQPYVTSHPGEINRLQLRGYSLTAPTAVAVPADEPNQAAGVFDPAEHTVDQVLTFLEEHPELADGVLAAEAQGKNRSTLVGS